MFFARQMHFAAANGPFTESFVEVRLFPSLEGRRDAQFTTEFVSENFHIPIDVLRCSLRNISGFISKHCSDFELSTGVIQEKREHRFYPREKRAWIVPGKVWDSISLASHTGVKELDSSPVGSLDGRSCQTSFFRVRNPQYLEICNSGWNRMSSS